MTRTKKGFLTRYDEKYIVVDFFHRKRGTIHGGYPIEEVAEITTRTSMRGGFCVVYPKKYSNAVQKCVDYIESKNGLGQGICNCTWDTFHANINAFIEDEKNAE
jgi:hypothetical protein